jgi:hypothetical protein
MAVNLHVCQPCTCSNVHGSIPDHGSRYAFGIDALKGAIRNVEMVIRPILPVLQEATARLASLESTS